MKVFMAHVKCWWHCLRHMWAGHCGMVTYAENGKTTMIAAVTGSIHDGSLEVQRVFYSVKL